jgi:hypothetical protein
MLASKPRPRRWSWYPSEVAPPPRPALTGWPRRGGGRAGGVERPLTWMGRSRRLSQDDEDLLERRATMFSLARTRLMRRRLARQAPYGGLSPP